MTKKLNRAPMSLDLDSFLQLQSSDDEDDLNNIPHRTVDEILNDSDSSSSSSSFNSPDTHHQRFSDLSLSNKNSVSLSKEESLSHEEASSVCSVETSPISRISTVDETLKSPDRLKLEEKFVESRISSFSRRSSGEFSGNSLFLGRSLSRTLPPLFGSVKPNPKPGAALAAAAAASRSIPTHAAAIKSRRERKSLQTEEFGSLAGDSEIGFDDSANFDGVASLDDSSNGVGSGITQLDSKFGEGDEKVENFVSSSVETVVDEHSNENASGGYEVAELSVERNEVSSVTVNPAGQVEVSELGKIGLGLDEDSKDLRSLGSIEYIEERITSSRETENTSNVDENSSVLDSDHAVEEHIPCYAASPDGGKLDENTTFSCSTNSAEKQNVSSFAEHEEVSNVEEELTSLRLENNELNETITNNAKDGEGNLAGDETCSKSDTLELVEGGLVGSNSKRNSKRTGKKSKSSMKPLELAEELEKKHAFSGLDWEEGVAAQPMRLEGIRRGPPAVGYLQIDPDNMITRTVSSQAFRRDHGSAKVLAVHANYIAVGMSKGLVLVVPSKYSPHHADHMDAKMLFLGSQGDKSQSPVTSMCFNQQGDLLLVGYADGHLTVWDVQRAAVAKQIAGEHTAPVVHTLFLGQDSQVTRNFKAVTGDCKGLVLLHAFSVVPLLNRFSIKTQCLLDGQRTGTVLSASPLLIDVSGSALTSALGNATASSSGIGSMMGGVVGGVVGAEAGWKLFSEGSSLVEEGVVIFVTHQTALVVRLTPNLEVYAQLPKPDGVREGSMPYTAWKCTLQTRDSSTENIPTETSDKASLLAIAWDRKVQVAKLVKSELKVYREWALDSSAIGVAWLDDQMLVVLTLRGHLCLFAKEGTELHRSSFSVDGSGADDLIAYHTYLTNIFGNPEKAYHNCVAVRGATIYILGSMQLVVSRLLPWKERIQVLRKAGDWMGALDMAMRLYDGQAHGVIDLPRTVDAIREAIMPYLVELVLSYVDEVFSYISVAFCNQIGRVEQVDDPKSRSSSVQSEMEEQFARVGGVAVEFCVHIKRIDILFDDIFSKFVAVQHGGTFLELLEPYILKDMLGCLPPEIMQALVEHYSSKGWLQRVEQCVLHMDISSLDFNQVVRLCREHGLYGALIYLFNRGLDDFRAPLEELLLVVQNSQRENASAIGYRMLVYLKYCFSGLAFPPGHGTISPTRLPSVRTELVQFLLEDSNAMISQSPTGFKSPTGACPNLYHLLWLDTEATLEVLRFAFLEEEVPKSDLDLVNANTEDNEKSNEKSKENQNLMVQRTVNSLTYILDLDISDVDGSCTNDTGSLEVWPSKKDIGHLLEFIACFVAYERATISKTVLSHILEYLASENNFSPPSQKIESSKGREKQVLSLLRVVPETDWDSSYVMHLCEKAQYYQVCGLIHTIRGQHIAALDSYMKDLEEPIYAFSFINNMLLQVRDNESATFRSAVISRIPELVILSREGTFFLVVDHFSKESQYILSELRPHSKSLFLYLKTIIEVHLSGKLNFSSLEKGYVLDVPNGRRSKDQAVEAYLKRISDFPKLLQHSSVNVTDDVVELYLELLCQYERSSVLKFLETFESYRVEHCLRLCQEYEVIDAAAFLLERVGDVGSALLLTLSGLNENFKILDTAVGNIVSDTSSSSLTEMEQLNTILRMEEVNAIRDILHASIGLCQRNTLRLDPEESESLWFQLLDSFCEPLRDSYDDKMVSRGNYVGKVAAMFDFEEDKVALTDKWRILKSHKGAHIFRKVFAQFIREIVEGMIGYLRLPSIMAKLLSDNGSQEFGDFKLTILGMLGTYGFERRILDTAKSLIEDDTFYTMSLLKKGASHGYAPHSLVCCICNSFLTKKYSSSGIRVFNCGHATHLQCEFQENESLNGDSSVGCPVCMPKKKTRQSRSKSKVTENGLVKNSLSRPQRTHGTSTVQQTHESDAEKPYGLQQISRFEILNNLQKAQKSFQLENLPQLRLAPPTVYHEKVKKGTAALMGESSTPPKSEKPNKNRQFRELKMKGSSLRFPLKSSIFGNEKTRKL
ncbi:Clathrin [Macleaya cordata]|uniref:Clathrin n=1 Tax=Macleaya cordata TaxID=56857 RepID=A0A200Q2K7_MACCD|nr:Clathrin [Macleaya cordata]